MTLSAMNEDSSVSHSGTFATPTKIPDSGKDKRKLDSGFQRDSAEGKCVWSLLPPHVWTLYSEKTKKTSEAIAEYLHAGDVTSLKDALTALIDTHGLTPMSERFAGGAKKYGPFNWALGAPLSVFIDSAGRHLYAINKPDPTQPKEDHIGAVMWNLACAIHVITMVAYGDMPDEYMDLPTYTDIKGFQAKLAKIAESTTK